MIHINWLEVRFGRSSWMDAAEALLALSGLTAILISPAIGSWKLASALLLLAGYLVLRRLAAGKNRAGMLRLFEDGTARIVSNDRVREAVATPHGWTSRWFSVIILRELSGGRIRRCLVCRSENHPEDYRNLLKFLRMRSTAADRQRMIW